MESIIQDLFWNGWRNTFSIAESFEKKKCDSKDKIWSYSLWRILCCSGTYCVKEFQLPFVNDTPSCKQFSKEQFLEREQIFLEFISKLVSDYTHIPETEKTENEVDHVVAYSKEVLSLGLLYTEFTDSICERRWNENFVLLALHDGPVQS